MASVRSFGPTALVLALAPLAAACSSAAAAPAHVLPAPPPKDDGRPSEGGEGGTSHSAALEQLKLAPLESRTDKQGALRFTLPDAAHWTRVKFWGVPSLVGYRYGKDHHAVFGAFVAHTDDPKKPGACQKSVETLAGPFVQAFEVDLTYEEPAAFPWHGEIGDVDRVFARTATLAQRDGYAVAYGTYPAWKGTCLIVGIAVPVRGDEGRARAVRDRFAQDILPKIERLAAEEPKELY